MSAEKPEKRLVGGLEYAKTAQIKRDGLFLRNHSRQRRDRSAVFGREESVGWWLHKFAGHFLGTGGNLRRHWNRPVGKDCV